MEFLTEELIYQKKPQELTSLLYEVLINNLYDSMDDIKEKNFINANKKLQKANDILYRLGAGLNYEAGIIADQLDHLYNFVADRIIDANYKKDLTIIEEVLPIVVGLSQAWNNATKKKPDQIQSQLRKRTNLYEQNVMVVEKELNQFEKGK